MTARRAAGVAALGAWAGLAYLLWQTTTVPSSLHLPHLDPRAYFSAHLLAQTASFERFVGIVWIAGTLVQLAVFAAYARWGAGFARESAAGPIGTGMLLGMLGFGLLWLAELPVQVLDLWWARRHGLAYTSYVDLIFGGWAQLGARFLLLCLALGIVMGLARRPRIGDRWWLPATPIFAALLLLDVFVEPYLLPTHRLTDPKLVAAARQLEATDRLHGIPVRVEDISASTPLPNSEATGVFSSRRVVLFDTMLDGRFTYPEVRFVIAHELGHVQRNHILKTVAWYTLLLAPEVFLIAWVARRRGGMRRAEAVPLALFAYVVINLVLTPVHVLVTRHMEAEADWRALVSTRDPAGGLKLFERFVPTTLSEPSPPTWDYVLLQDHPTIMQRMAMTVAWRRLQS